MTSAETPSSCSSAPAASMLLRNHRPVRDHREIRSLTDRPRFPKGYDVVLVWHHLSKCRSPVETADDEAHGSGPLVQRCRDVVHDHVVRRRDGPVPLARYCRRKSTNSAPNRKRAPAACTVGVQEVAGTIAPSAEGVGGPNRTGFLSERPIETAVEVTLLLEHVQALF